jgi:hypothetical protein
VARLERGVAPPTTADLRTELRRLAATGRTLERRYALDGVDDVVAAFAAATRLRAAATEAVGDRRTTGARRLFTSARTLDLRGRELAADLAGRCPGGVSSERR